MREALFLAETDMTIKIRAFQAVLEQFGATFMLLEQLGAGNKALYQKCAKCPAVSPLIQQ